MIKIIKHAGIILLAIFFIVLGGATGCKKNQDAEYQLTDEDEIKIIKLVNQYYESISNGDFYEALQFCDLTNNEIDLNTRVIALQEVWAGTIEKFSLRSKANKVEIYLDGSNREFGVKVSIDLKYKDTPGGFAGEFVYVDKVNDEWKIKKIYGLDRYGFYRANVYQYDRLIDFLNPKSEAHENQQ